MSLPRRMPIKRSTSKVGGYSLIQNFKGYRAKEDPTTLSPEYLVAPSRNVKIGSSGRLAHVKGYTLDGAASAVFDSGILSHKDFSTFKGDVRNMRAGFLTSAGNDGKLQFRYRTGSGTVASPYVVNWVTLKSSLTNVRLSFCEFWDNAIGIKQLLWVDGTNNVYSWNGAVTTFASATATTLTKQGTNTWAQEGFAQTGTRSIVINGVSATYTGGEGTTTLTGVSVDFSTTGVGAIIHQAPITTALSAMTGISAAFGPYIIGCGRRNQVYLGSSTSNNIYISKVNSYTDYSFTAPTRVVGEGALIPLDAPPRGFLAQESQSSADAEDMYISEGLGTWGVIRATLSSDLTKETLQHIRLKSSELQASKSERLMGNMKNHIMFVGNDNTANFLGYLSYKFVPTIVDFSAPIIDDMSSYDFTDGSIFHHKNYVYIFIPKAGVVRIYNMTNQDSEQFSGGKALEDVTQQPWFWEAPIGYPMSGAYVVDGEIYGHSYTTSESYKLFSGGSFNGQEIDTYAVTAYNDLSDRTQSKASTELWVEGYIKQNTILKGIVAGDLDSFRKEQRVTIDGNDSEIVAYGSGGNSLGDASLGVQTLGGSSNLSNALPAWFHTSKTYSADSCYLEQIIFATKGVDLYWEIICFGTNIEFTNEGNNSITS